MISAEHSVYRVRSTLMHREHRDVTVPPTARVSPAATSRAESVNSGVALPRVWLHKFVASVYAHPNMNRTVSADWSPRWGARERARFCQISWHPRVTIKRIRIPPADVQGCATLTLKFAEKRLSTLNHTLIIVLVRERPMPLTGEAKKTYNRRKYAESGRQQARLLPFAGVDGEGGDIETGRQEYLLLRAGTQVLETGKPLQPMECLRFIADLPPTHTYVSYSFNYDVTMILRDLPMNRWVRVLERSKRVGTYGCYPVDIPYRESAKDIEDGDVQVDYLPSKEFKVRIRRGGEWGKFVRIHDTFTFFQTSFLNTITTWLGDDPRYADVIKEIAENKARRADFGPMTDTERHYNAQECVMLARVMTLFAVKLDQAGIPALKDWQGPGNIAAALFRKHGLPRRPASGKTSVNGAELLIGREWPEVVAIANRAYYGGRFEPCMIGEIHSTVYQYDIRSAYAAMYRHLPCLVHGKWKRTDAPKLFNIGFAHIRFRHPKDINLGSFPVRLRNGTIQFPIQGEGVYTHYEIMAALTSDNITITDIEFLGGWEYVKRCECVWMHFAEDLYKARQRVAKDDPNLGRVFKLALASMYGKLAQSIGEPVYSNPVWASLITGYVRAQLLGTALRVNYGAGVIMLATDGIFTLDKIPDVDVGTDLGQWELTEHAQGMMVIQSGVYLIHGEDGDKIKSRGVPMKALADQTPAFRRAWTHFLETQIDPECAWNRWENDRLVPHHIEVKRNMFYGLRLAKHLNKPELAGTWDYNYTRQVGFNWRTKRNPRVAKNMVYPEGSIHSVVSTHPPVGPLEATLYYSKDIGKMGTEAGLQMELVRLEDSEMP